MKNTKNRLYALKKKSEINRKKHMTVFLQSIPILTATADILIKQSVERNLGESDEKEIMGGRVILRKVYNEGFAFNILEKRPKIVTGVSCAVGAAVFLYGQFLMTQKKRVLEKTGIMLASGGAWSNFFDRAVRGRVVDYLAIKTKWKKAQAVTFNIGDLCIFAGALSVLAGRLLYKRKKR